MNEKNKKILIISIIIIIIGFFVYQNLNKGIPDEIAQEKDSRDIAIKGFVNKYNALIDWDDEISSTLQLQELVESDKILLFTGYIDDIFKEEDQYFISFITDYYIYPQIKFVLKTDSERIKEATELIKKDPLNLGFFGEYIVVADVSDIKKINFEISGHSVGPEEVSIECDPARNYVATGDCIDFTYIPYDFDED